MIAILKLVRLPNVFTAISNIIAAGIIGAAAFGLPLSWPTALLALSSAALYMSGMAFNDFADHEEDTRHRPNRPIPSGKISPAAAFFCAALLMAAGLGLAYAASPFSLYAAVSLAILILLYDFGTAGVPVLGALTLGACRFFNVLLGFSAIMPISANVFTQDPLQVPLAPALIVGLYAAGVTAFSTQEEKGRDRRALVLGWLLVDAAMVLAVFATVNVLALPLLALLWTLVFHRSYQLRAQPSPRAARNMIRTAVMNMPLLDAALIAGFAGFAAAPWGLLCVALLLPGMLLGRWLAQKEA